MNHVYAYVQQLVLLAHYICIQTDQYVVKLSMLVQYKPKGIKELKKCDELLKRNPMKKIKLVCYIFCRALICHQVLFTCYIQEGTGLPRKK